MGELAFFSKGKGYTKKDLIENNGLPIILYGRLYTNYETVIENIDTYTMESKDAIISEGNEVIVPASGESADEIARASVVAKPGIILGGDLNIIKLGEDTIPTFLALLISNGKSKRILKKLAQGNSVVHLYNSSLKILKIKRPIIEEQIKISSFIMNLENTILLHQRKLIALKRLKEAYLQNMFPKNGESAPKLRFANFKENWEQRKLGEVANIIGGGTPSTTNKDFWGGSIDWYSPIEIGDKIYVCSSSKKITNLGLQKSSAKLLPIGTILFTSRAGIGNTAILAKEGTTNQGFQSIVPIEGLLDSYFIYSRTNELKRYGETNGAGSTFVEVSGKQMAKMNIPIPNLNEQIIVGKTFKEIDRLIKLQLTKIDNLKLLKAAYLQKIFI